MPCAADVVADLGTARHPTVQTRIETKITRNANCRERESLPCKRVAPRGYLLPIIEKYAKSLGGRLVSEPAECRDRYAYPFRVQLVEIPDAGVEHHGEAGRQIFGNLRR